uniref:Uncharacterized protein n=1 Tax=Cercocebus atys TaxID=9531 RepID=A0A2K5NHA2_CERAT
MCWGYRGSEHLPHTGRTLAPTFTVLRETFGEQREAGRGMGPHLSSIRGRARACPTSLLAPRGSLGSSSLAVGTGRLLRVRAAPPLSPLSGVGTGGQSQGREEDRARLTPQLSP